MHKSKFPFLNNKLFFNEKKHEYLYKQQKLDSVTTWLSSFEEPFNPYKISEEVSRNPNSEYYGLEPDKIRKLWQSTALRGSQKHSTIEDWLTEKQDNCLESDFLINLGINPKNSWSEVPLISTKLMLAGTADIITFENEIFYIWDIKTAKKIDDNKIKKFSLQILTYCILLRHMTDGKIKIAPGGIISIKPADNLSDGLTNNFESPQFININKNISQQLKLMLKSRKREVGEI
jgi:hypothetical protein